MGIVSDQDLHQWMRTKYAKWWAMLKLGDDGIMLNRMQRQLRASEKLADIAVKGPDGVTSLYPESEEEDMAVNIGNESHYHFHNESTTEAPAPNQPPTSPVTNTNTTTETTTIKETSKNPVWPYVLAGVLGLSSLGGWTMAWYNSNNNPVPTVDTDTDSQTDVVFPQ